MTLADGRRVRARRLLVTTGLTDELPDVPGLRERWGREVLHCPYCHGWEVRDQAIGVLASGPMSVHQALLFRQLSPDVAYFLQGTTLTDEQAEQFAARGITVVNGAVAGLEIVDDRLTGVRMSDGRLVPPGRAGRRAADGRAGGLPRGAGPGRGRAPERRRASTSRRVSPG